MSDLVHIALAANHRYAKGLRATFVSMIKACREPARLRFHVFSDGLTDEDKRILVSLGKREGYCEAIDFREPVDGSLLPETLPEFDWIIRTDVETLWFKDPIDIWEQREERYLLSPDTHIENGVVIPFRGIGELFNESRYTGWRPLYEIWFRYYAQIIEAQPLAVAWPLWKHVLFNVLGLLYPMAKALSCHPRILFDSWLRGRALW